MIQTEESADPFRGDRAVERGYQGQPATGGVAKGSRFAERIHGRLIASSEAGAGGSEAHNDRTFGDGANSERGHHVVATPGAHRNTGLQAQRRGSFGTQLTQHAERRYDVWERARPVALVVNRAQDGGAVRALADIEVRSARGVTRLGGKCSGEP